ncbi:MULTISPECIES: hypothetical protein [unclassified Methanosarcina]|uniref:hypothetical protein n=1 Tax=unclassified Methanosarcina TaxID=2644672 RepID=UPI0012E01484|nr:MULTISPECIES: hypothetical protein [unclassified Methanosarcina]
MAWQYEKGHCTRTPQSPSGTGFTSISIEPGSVPWKYGFPEEFLKHLEEIDSPKEVLKEFLTGSGRRSDRRLSRNSEGARLRIFDPLAVGSKINPQKA